MSEDKYYHACLEDMNGGTIQGSHDFSGVNYFKTLFSLNLVEKLKVISSLNYGWIMWL